MMIGSIFTKIKKDVYELYSHILNKVWLYNDNIIVVDFIYNNFSFAYDIYDEDGCLKIDFVDRDLKFYKNDNKKRVVSSNVDESDILNTLSIHLKSVIKNINELYEFPISIVIPVYNRELIIKKCIDSINSQTLDRSLFEVIFVDDYSKDNTVNAIEKFIDKSINFEILRRPIGSGNASAPRNEGIKAAKGRYIFFVDSDDTIAPYTLEDGLKSIQENNSDIVYFKMFSDNERQVPIRPYKNGDINKADIIKNHLMRSLSVFKFLNKEMLIKNRILFNPSISVAEDKLFMLDCLCAARNVSILAEKKYYCVSLHDQGHLSRTSFVIEDMFYIISLGFLTIYNAKRSFEIKKKLYNAWMVIALEQTMKLINAKKYNYAFKNRNYTELYNISSLGFLFLDKK